MKKFIFLLLCLFSFTSFVLADGSEVPVSFTITDKSYAEVIRSYNNRYIFTYTNNILNNSINLKNILNQNIGSPLTYYEELNIKVKPLSNTPYEVLNNYDLLRATTFNWTDNKTSTAEMPNEAIITPLEDKVYIPGFNISFRKTTNDEYTNVIPNGLDLTNKTLEEQLATLLDIDLDSDPNGVINTHNSLWKFDILDNKYLTYRFDFFKDSDSKKLISNDEYKTSSLEKLGTEYVVIEYKKGNANSVFKLDDVDTKENYASVIFLFVLSLGSATYFYLKRANI